MWQDQVDRTVGRRVPDLHENELRVLDRDVVVLICPGLFAVDQRNGLSTLRSLERCKNLPTPGHRLGAETVFPFAILFAHGSGSRPTGELLAVDTPHLCQLFQEPAPVDRRCPRPAQNTYLKLKPFPLSQSLTMYPAISSVKFSPAPPLSTATISPRALSTPLPLMPGKLGIEKVYSRRHAGDS